MRPALRFLRNVLLMLIASVFLFALIEGMASLALFAGGMLRTSRTMMVERKHTLYDPEIGWVNAPNLRMPDLYAPGIGITSNSRGFRGSAEVTREVPPGKRRVVCSGDSFTLGYGVRDQHAWCAQLAAMDSRIDAVNLGMGGYGIDQMYLWYRRNAPSIDHNLHVLAVTGDDFNRVRAAKFFGYGKPLLDVAGGVVSVRQPVPRASRWTPYALKASRLAADFRTIAFLKALGWSPEERERLPISRTKEILTAVLDDVQRIAQQRSSGVLLLYIPYPEECNGNGVHLPWRTYWKEEASRRRLPFLDLTADCMALGNEAASRLYILDGKGYHVGAAVGHQNEHGHRFVAERLLPLLKSALSAAP